MGMILVIDNYDSFTFNLVQYLGELGAELRVMRNDTVTVDDVRAAAPSAIVISPGPGRPEQAGAGIVADSNPETEYQETLSKSRALLEAIRTAAAGLRTIESIL